MNLAIICFNYLLFKEFDYKVNLIVNASSLDYNFSTVFLHLIILRLIQIYTWNKIFKIQKTEYNIRSWDF
jgi:hypothetical protein